jgi:hypothetical protein
MLSVRTKKNSNGLLEGLVAKDYIDIVYKKAKHTLMSVLEYSMSYQIGVAQNMCLVSHSLETCISMCHFVLYKEAL